MASFHVVGHAPKGVSTTRILQTYNPQLHCPTLSTS